MLHAPTKVSRYKLSKGSPLQHRQEMEQIHNKFQAPESWQVMHPPTHKEMCSALTERVHPGQNKRNLCVS